MLSALAAIALLEIVSHAPFEASGRVLFFGDSITAQGYYPNHVETFIRSRYPKSRMQFYNVGVPGDASWGGPSGTFEQRIERDVRPFKADRIFVMLGMNDGGYINYSERLEQNFSLWYSKLARELRSIASDANITLALTSPYDAVTKVWSGERQGFSPEYNDALVRYGKVIATAAQKTNSEFVDCNSPLLEVLDKAKKRDLMGARGLIPDAVHPGEAASVVIASALLKSWHVSGEVSSVEVDARTNRVTNSTLCRARMTDDLDWLQTDERLPFPSGTHPLYALVYGVYDFNSELNRQMLKVHNLGSGKYRFWIDTTLVGEFSGQQLERGINLANFDTPMMQQARRLAAAIAKKNLVARNAWQSLRLQPDRTSMVSRIDEATQDWQGKLWDYAMTRTYRYRLTPTDPPDPGSSGGLSSSTGGGKG